MGHRWRDAVESDDFGVVSFQLQRAALCCEESCEAVFDMLPRHDLQGAGRCPGCGGQSWVPLSTIVPSLRAASQRVQVAVLARA
jgi:hypothetical protein